MPKLKAIYFNSLSVC